MKKNLVLHASIFITLGCFSSSPASEAFLYEPFDYGLIEGDALFDLTVQAQGLQGKYVRPGHVPNSIVEFQTEGLSFSAEFFPVIGGAVRLVTSEETTASSLHGKLDFEPSDTLWHSYLFSFDDFSGGGHASTALLSGMTSAAKAGNSGVGSGNQPRPGIAYIGRPGGSKAGWETGVAEPVDIGLVPNTTYLLISCFEDFRQPLNENTSPLARLWVFDAQNFEAWLAAGEGKEETLTDYANWRAESPLDLTGKSWDELFPPENSNFFIHNYLSSVFTIDEIRIGPTLESVAIP